MRVLRVMLKYVGCYILTMALISIFAGSPIRDILMTLCGAALSVSMFAAIVQLFFGGNIGAMAHNITTWCLHGTIITTVIVIIAKIGFGNIVKVFTG